MAAATALVFVNASTAQQALLDVFPESPVKAAAGGWSCALSENYEPSGSKWAKGLDERHVFQAAMTHREAGSVLWRLGIGAGGHIYSLRGPFGESVPPQEHPGAPWIDEVWQLVAVCHEKNDRTMVAGRRPMAYFIHQSGVYMRDPQLKRPFYSPLLASHYDAAGRSYSLVNWPQQAHVPTAHRSGALYYTRFRDCGDGVIEITYVIYNFGPDTLDFFNIPWGGVRTSSLPVHMLSKADGASEVAGGRFNQKGNIRTLAETGGWAVFAQAASARPRYALALVFGTDRHLAEQSKLADSDPRRFQTRPSPYRWGIGGGPKRDYTVGETIRRFNLTGGRAVFARVFMIVGTLERVVARARRLAPDTDYGLLEFTEQNAKLLPLYVTRHARTGQTVLSTVRTGGARPALYTYAQPVAGSLPLFLMQDTTSGKLLTSTDPYILCSAPPPAGDSSILRPYDGRTKYLGLLGFVMPAERANAKKFTYVNLADVAADRSFYPTDDDLHRKLKVRAAQ